MSVTDDIRNYLEGVGITGVAVGFFPNENAGIVLYETGGYPSDQEYGANTSMDRPTFQIRVRNPSYSAGRCVCTDIYNALDGLSNLEINGVFYQYVRAASGVNYFGKTPTNDGETHQWTLNFDAMHTRGVPVIGLCGVYFDLSGWQSL